LAIHLTLGYIRRCIWHLKQGVNVEGRLSHMDADLLDITKPIKQPLQITRCCAFIEPTN
jgi:hypothetical protein